MNQTKKPERMHTCATCAITVVDYHNLHGVLSILPELIVQAGGTVAMAPLLALLSHPAAVASPFLRRSVLALISGCAATTAQRTRSGDLARPGFRREGDPARLPIRRQ